MKAILISIKPEWVVKILNGEKTIEIRKTCPAIFKHLKSYEGAKLDVYIYCTKVPVITNMIDDTYYNGKVVAKFTLNKVEEIEIVYSQENEFGGYSESYGTKTLSTNELLNKSQLDYFELAEYLKDYTPFGYAWHISNLVIFDKPKELSDFYRFGVDEWAKKHAGTEIGYLEFWNGIDDFRLTKGPQSWCYVEDLL